eukprot:12249581-Alexandrium_andersonii.AAC.1
MHIFRVVTGGQRAVFHCDLPLRPQRELPPHRPPPSRSHTPSGQGGTTQQRLPQTLPQPAPDGDHSVGEGALAEGLRVAALGSTIGECVLLRWLLGVAAWPPPVATTCRTFWLMMRQEGEGDCGSG